MSTRTTTTQSSSPDTPSDAVNALVGKSKSQLSGTTHFHPEATEKGTWIRLNHRGINHDNRRLMKHRARNCECFVCYREMFKLPPSETHEEYVSSMKIKMKEREIKRIKRIVKKEVKTGKQATINSFFKNA